MASTFTAARRALSTLVGSPGAWRACPKGHGDLNRDGVIDDTDLEIFRSYYFKQYYDPNLPNFLNPEEYPTMYAADFDSDGYVGGKDFTVMTALLEGYCPICKLNLEPVAVAPAPPPAPIPPIPEEAPPEVEVIPWVYPAAALGVLAVIGLVAWRRIGG